jgi:glycosyltransferase involved in cell wall biosynthesis
MQSCSIRDSSDSGDSQDRAGGPRTVVLVSDHYPPVVGGAETLVRELAEGLAAAGDRVLVVTQRVPRDAPARECRGGCEIRRLWVPPRLGRLWFLLFAGFAVARLARGADLVHAAGYAAMWPAWWAARWRRRPAVATVYEVLGEQWFSGTGLSWWSAAGYRWLEQRLMRLRFTRYLCISSYTADRLVRLAAVDGKRVAVAYPAVDYRFWDPQRHAPRPLRSELGLPQETRIALFFGRPGVSKGVDTLLAAIQEMANDMSDRPVHCVLLLAREPADRRAAVLRTIERTGIAHRVTVLEPVPRAELPGYLLAADCVVVPSLSEGFGYSAIESASLGCPVVATAGHVFEEVLGSSASYVPVGDARALAAAIQETAWNPPQPRQLLPPVFSLARHLAAVESVYTDILPVRRTS